MSCCIHPSTPRGSGARSSTRARNTRGGGRRGGDLRAQLATQPPTSAWWLGRTCSPALQGQLLLCVRDVALATCSRASAARPSARSRVAQCALPSRTGLPTAPSHAHSAPLGEANGGGRPTAVSAHAAGCRACYEAAARRRPPHGVPHACSAAMGGFVDSQEGHIIAGVCAFTALVIAVAQARGGWWGGAGGRAGTRGGAGSARQPRGAPPSCARTERCVTAAFRSRCRCDNFLTAKTSRGVGVVGLAWRAGGAGGL